MKITIYELLGLIKDGKAPYKFLFQDDEYRWDYQDEKYYRKAGIDELDQKYYELFEDDFMLYQCLNDEIEIIEEVEDKEYEDITELEIKHIEDTEHLYMKETINALIRNQKYILERINRGEWC